MSVTVTWTKLKDGTWGLRSAGGELTPGADVTVQKKDGVPRWPFFEDGETRTRCVNERHRRRGPRWHCQFRIPLHGPCPGHFDALSGRFLPPIIRPSSPLNTGSPYPLVR